MDTVTSEEVLRQLRSFLDETEPSLVRLLMSLWQAEGKAITYKELREAILNGEVSYEYLAQWQQDYSLFVTETMEPMWLLAMEEAVTHLNERMEGGHRVVDWFNPMREGVRSWVRERGAAFVTNSTQTQINALRAVVGRAAVMEDIGVDELAHVIRPMVGLTEQQAVANMKYYETLLENKVTPKKAHDLALRYAARQHRYRGTNIARTELAFAYNKGADEGTRQAQEAGMIGEVWKVWSTAKDERVCPICGAMNGRMLEMDEEYPYPTKLAASNPGIRLTPPAHPGCRCAVMYVEKETWKEGDENEY